MKRSHLWFRSGSYTLLAHLTEAEGAVKEIAALIVPPFGWEDISSYRSLRSLSDELAAQGIHSLRFDLPGTGDSSGASSDQHLVEAWVQAVFDMAAALKSATGVDHVAMVGVRLGAVLALAAASRGADVSTLVLWGGSAGGRSLLREMRAFSNMTESERAPQKPEAPPAIPNLEVAGFVMTPETQQALERLDLTSLPPLPGKRILTLTRDNLPHDAKLTAALQKSGCAIEAETGAGYAGMMNPPHEAAAPLETFRAIAAFLQRSIEGATVGLLRLPISATKEDHFETEGLRETVHCLDHAGDSLFAILSQPVPRVKSRNCGVLYLNPGAIRHIGPNRMWVDAARRWAERGVASLRLDFKSIGESDGEGDLSNPSLYKMDIVEQIESAMSLMRSLAGVERFVAVGLCSGAFGAFQAALRHTAVRTAVLINPRLFFWDPEVDRRRELRRIVSGFGDPSDWRKLVGRQISLERLLRAGRAALSQIHLPRRAPSQVPAKLMAKAWSDLERSGSSLTMVFSQNEPLLFEMEDEKQLPPAYNSRIKLIRIATGDHTLRPVWSQEMLHRILDSEIVATLEAEPSVLMPEASSFARTRARTT